MTKKKDMLYWSWMKKSTIWERLMLKIQLWRGNQVHNEKFEEGTIELDEGTNVEKNNLEECNNVEKDKLEEWNNDRGTTNAIRTLLKEGSLMQ